MSAGKEDFLDFTIKIVETSLELMRIKSQEIGNSPVTKHVFIFDLEGFSLAVSLNKCRTQVLAKLIYVFIL